MDSKHPVSSLQELMAIQHKQLPMYEIADISTRNGSSFRCTVTVDGIKATATASSKQSAKKEAAIQALTLLGYSEIKSIAVNNLTSPPVAYNAVGKLNEFTAQSKLPYPTYSEYGLNEKGEFISKCILLEHCAEGVSPTKKAAKQLAAHQMLKQLEGKQITNNSCVSSKNESISDELVIKKFNELRICSNMLSPLKAEEKPNNIETVSPIKEYVPTGSSENLYKALQEINVSYSIDVISKSPCVLILKFKNDDNTTVVESGDNYEETHFHLLQSALKVITTWKETA